MQFKPMLFKGQLYIFAVWRRLRMEVGRSVWRCCVVEAKVDMRVLAVELESEQICSIFFR